MGLEEKYKKYPNENLSVYAKAHTRVCLLEMCNGGSLTCSEHPVTLLMKQQPQTMQIKVSEGSGASFKKNLKDAAQTQRTV